MLPDLRSSRPILGRPARSVTRDGSRDDAEGPAPRDRSYSESHFWLQEQEPGTWRVGYTKFAMRMLGEPVEIDFELQPGSPVELGQVVDLHSEMGRQLDFLDFQIRKQGLFLKYIQTDFYPKYIQH